MNLFKKLFGKSDNSSGTENQQSSGKQKTIELDITGMTCDHCATGIEKKFAGKKGVLKKQVSYLKGKGTFVFDAGKTSKKEIIDTINATSSYKVVDENGTVTEKTGSETGEMKDGPGYQYDLIIIGGGSAAFSAAINANELGLSALLVNGGLDIGGTCVNAGCLPSKHLIRAAESIHRASHSPFDGITPNKPNWNYGTIIRQKKELVKVMQQRKYMDVVKDFPKLTIVEGMATFVDSRTIEVNGEARYTGAKFVVGTGSTTAIPPIKGLDKIGYLTNETLFDLEELPESITIIGGGYIGLEIAQAYKRFGSRVRIIEFLDRILTTETKDITDELTKHFTEEGIEILTGIKLEKVFRDRSKAVLYGTQNGKPVQFDEPGKIVVAAGRKPNTQNLGLEKTGVETLKSGHIKVNENLVTNIPNIYAVGDCNPNPPFVYTAAYEGKIAVQNAFNSTNKKADYTGMPWVVFTDPQVAGAGMDEQVAEAKGIPFDTSVVPLSEVPRSAAALDTRGFIKLVRNPETDKLLGARIVAPEGSELAMQASLAIKYGIPVTELAESFHPYLTLSEGIKLAAITFKKDVTQLSCCAS